MPRQRTSASAPSDKAHLLQLLAHPGCIYCREEQEALDRFFAWYLIEQYTEPETRARLRRAGGFCRVHTRVLVARALPSQLTTIYLDLVAAGSALLRSVEHPAPSMWRRSQDPPAYSAALAHALAPQGACPACDSQARARGALTRVVRQHLTDQEIRAALDRARALCLLHLLEIAPTLEWLELQCLSGELRNYLAAPSPAGTLVGAVEPGVGEFDPLLTLLRGTETHEMPPRRELENQTCSAPASHDLDAAHAPWSPTITTLQQQLQRAACPLCLAESRVVASYVSWACGEWTRMPPREPDQILWLCRQHSWGFARMAPALVVARYAALLREYWAGTLTQFEQDLAAVPPLHLLPRLWHSWAQLRGQAESRPLWRRVRAAWERSMPTRMQLLATRRAARLRVAPCPICQAQQVQVNRLSGLLARALHDPRTVRIYRDAQGVCFHHLASAVRACRDADEVSLLLLQAQRLRLDVVQWELEEAERKRNWSVRWEPPGSEGTAWRRAIAYYTGAFAVEDGDMVQSETSDPSKPDPADHR